MISTKNAVASMANGVVSGALAAIGGVGVYNGHPRTWFYVVAAIGIITMNVVGIMQGDEEPETVTYAYTDISDLICSEIEGFHDRESDQFMPLAETIVQSLLTEGYLRISS